MKHLVRSDESFVVYETDSIEDSLLVARQQSERSPGRIYEIYTKSHTVQVPINAKIWSHVVTSGPEAVIKKVKGRKT